jgi:hypothetical protein
MGRNGAGVKGRDEAMGLLDETIKRITLKLH